MLAVAPDHAEEMGAERRVGLVLPPAPDKGTARRDDGLLHLVRHLHARYRLHLSTTRHDTCSKVAFRKEAHFWLFFTF